RSGATGKPGVGSSNSGAFRECSRRVGTIDPNVRRSATGASAEDGDPPRAGREDRLHRVVLGSVRASPRSYGGVARVPTERVRAPSAVTLHSARTTPHLTAV